MNHVNNIPTGLLVPAQVPLDAKRVVLTNEILENLGVDNHLAFTYEDGLIVFSVASRQRWEWRQRRTPVEGDTSLLTTDFVYPDGHVIAGIDYSLKAFNFFLKREAFLLSNIGSGDPVYKGFNAVNEKHEFYTLKTDNKIRLSYPSGDPGVLLFTAPGVDSFSTFGTSIYKGYDSNENEFQFYTLDSTDIKITQDVNTGIINLSLPQSSSIPTIYISQDYEPTYDDWYKANRLANPSGPINTFEYKGEGTLAKPFTNTTKYVLGNEAIAPAVTANTAIQNGLDYYQGPSNTRLDPLKRGQKIQILSSSYAYVFAGDFNYTDLDLEIYGSIISTTSGKLVDMDDPANFLSWSSTTPPNQSTYVKIYLDAESVLQIQGTGFWNSGYDIPGTVFTHDKSLRLSGKGKILSYENSTSKYIINSGITFPYNNAGFATFAITCKIHCPGYGTAPGGQGAIQNGGLGKVVISDGAEISVGRLIDPINVNIIPIKITGGFVKITDSNIGINGGNNGGDNGPGVTTAISLNKIGDLDTTGGPQFYAVNTTFGGYAETWFDRAGQAGNLILSNCSTIYFGGTNLIKSTGTTTIWGGSDEPDRGSASLKNNTFDFITVDTTEVDLTINGYQAVFNAVGQNLIQSLKIFDSVRTAKIINNVPLGGVFIKRVVLNDEGQFNQYRVGDEFQILTQSTPPFDFGPYSLQGGTITAVGSYFQRNNTNSLNWPNPGVQLAYDQVSVVS